MIDPLDSDIQNRRLWRQYVAKADSELSDPGEIDPNALAAYVDGSADPKQVELLEARMTSDPAFLDEVIQLRQMADLESIPAPAVVLSRAKALGHPHTWRPRLRWAAAAAAVLVASFLGYSMGGTTLESHRQAQTFVSATVSMEIDELISEPTFGIILPTNGNNGR